MRADDPAIRTLVGRCMVARIATLSRHGRPSVNPLYFVLVNGRIWLGTADWTLAARNAAADPRVTVIFQPERGPLGRAVVRIRGRATVRSDGEARRTYSYHVIRKYLLTPGGILNVISHLGLLRLRMRYYAQSAEKGRTCLIEVVPEEATLLQSVLG